MKLSDIYESDDRLRTVGREAAQGDPSAVVRYYTQLKRAGGFEQFEQPDPQIKRDLDLLLRVLGIKSYFPNTRHNVMLGTELLLEPVTTILKRAFPNVDYERPFGRTQPRVHSLHCSIPYPPEGGDQWNRDESVSFCFSEGPTGGNGSPFCYTTTPGGFELEPDTYWFNRVRLGLL
jgi:hypothetical protein